VAETSKRLVRAREAAALRAKGWPLGDIAMRMGISRSYAAGLLSDPDGSKDKKRKEKYAGVCVDCGGRTFGDSHTPALRCMACSIEWRRREHPNVKWSKQRILEAFRWWNEEFGEPPSMSDFNPYQTRDKFTSRKRHQRSSRLIAEGRVPWFTTVIYQFGSWNEAMRQAGFKPRRAHGSPENSERRLIG
jgi:transcriptional regulator with XRE-family HTH domain